MLDIHCVKQGTPSIHPIRGDESTRAGTQVALRLCVRAPFTLAGFARTIERAGIEAHLASSVIRTRCVMPADMRSPTRDTKHAPCKFTWDTATFNTLCATPNYHRRALRTSGANSLATATWCRIEAP